MAEIITYIGISCFVVIGMIHPIKMHEYYKALQKAENKRYLDYELSLEEYDELMKERLELMKNRNVRYFE